MPDEPKKPQVPSSMQATQSAIQQAGPLMTASYSLVGGIVVLGGLGYAFDAWRSTEPWGLVIGLALGVVVGFYQLIKTVSRRS
jgi:F0F1-type ATP synthase assembly protein I